MVDSWRIPVMGAPNFFSAIGPSRVNMEAGIIEGVSVITSGIEAEGHGIFIDDTTLEQVRQCASEFADGVRVKANHGTGFDSIVGTLRNFRIEGSKLLADLHLLKSHEMRARIIEMAEDMPGSVGLSISFSGSNEKQGGKMFARCEELYSVDLVDRPAANPSGLFSAGVDSKEKGMDDPKSIIAKIKEFISGAEKELAEPINFEARATELEGKLSESAKALAASVARVSELEAEAAKTKTDFEAKEKALAEREKNLSAEVELKASEKAAAINASLGVPPLAASNASTAGKQDFTALVSAQVALGKSKAEAVGICVKNHPAEYAEWRKSGKTQTL